MVHELRGFLVRINIEFGLHSQFFVADMIILVSFDPLDDRWFNEVFGNRC